MFSKYGDGLDMLGVSWGIGFKLRWCEFLNIYDNCYRTLNYN